MRVSKSVVTSTMPLNVNCTFGLLKMNETGTLDFKSNVLKGLISSGTLVAIYGPPKSGKSFIVIDMAVKLATGADWAGFRVSKKHRTFYLPLEGHCGVRHRLKALEIQNPALVKEADETFRYSNNCSLNLNSEKSVNDFISGLKEWNPEVIIIDTLARAMVGLSEVTFEDMSKVLAALANIQRELSCTLIFVHHTPKSGHDLRGHNSLIAAIETGIEVTRSPKSGIISVSAPIQKDFESELNFAAFELQSVEIGNDEDGEPLKSCVLALKGCDTGIGSSPSIEREPSKQNVFTNRVRQICEKELTRSGDTIAKGRITEQIKAMPEFSQLSEGTIRGYQTKAFQALPSETYTVRQRDIVYR